MQDIVYKLVPGLQEGKCHVSYYFMVRPPWDPANNRKTVIVLNWCRLYMFSNGEEKIPFNKIFLLSLLGVRKQVTVRTHT